MRHIPNIITLLNLLFGCLAIAFILEERILFHTFDSETYYPVMNFNKIYWGALFIFLAALMDVFDGLAARVLNATSAIGKDLDSLADVVSFGVAPSMIIYKYIQLSYMAEPGAIDTPTLVVLPAFFIAMMGAVRLARYNQTAGASDTSFIGVPIPAVGIIIATIPLIAWYPSSFVLKTFPQDYHFSMVFENRWILYLISLVVGLLMVSKIRLFKWKPATWAISDMWPHLILLAVILIGGILLHFLIVPLAFILYVLLSLIYFKNK